MASLGNMKTGGGRPHQNIIAGIVLGLVVVGAFFLMHGNANTAHADIPAARITQSDQEINTTIDTLKTLKDLQTQLEPSAIANIPSGSSLIDLHVTPLSETQGKQDPFVPTFSASTPTPNP